MSDYAALEALLTRTLSLTRRPVAIAIRDSAPPGVAPLTGSQPSGCSFWTLASGGQVFSTVPSDHYNCAIGSYTHHIPLPAAREHELTDTLAYMSDLGYIRMEEVPGIPRLPSTPGVMIYAPLAATPVEPDAVLIAGRPGAIMRLQEAALSAGASMQALLGRPTCMAIPASLSSAVVTSLGCIGNRVYSGLSEEEMYTVIGGRALLEIAARLETITGANLALAAYHEGRVATLRV